MCRALKVLCAAPSLERLTELKRAVVSATWELVGGASSASPEGIASQVAEWQPDVVVLDASLGPEVIAAVRGARPIACVIAVGSLDGVDIRTEGLDGLRQAVAAWRKPGGPVRG
jgi:hypothetical protein